MMKFLVIEGLDGSGKSTQIKKLQNYLTDHQIKYEYLHFPRTDTPIFGDLVARFLRGELGKIDEVNPYLVALMYAGDRNDAKTLINNWLHNDTLVIVDRYVNSNIGYQCAKIKDVKEKNSLRDWILNLEYDYHKIPKPDASIYLDVPFEFTRKSLENARQGDDRTYLNGATDIHEENLDFQSQVREVYLDLAKTDPCMTKIDCADDNGKMLPPDEIFSKMMAVIKEKNII